MKKKKAAKEHRKVEKERRIRKNERIIGRDNGREEHRETRFAAKRAGGKRRWGAVLYVLFFFFWPIEVLGGEEDGGPL